MLTDLNIYRMYNNGNSSDILIKYMYDTTYITLSLINGFHLFFFFLNEDPAPFIVTDSNNKQAD